MTTTVCMGIKENVTTSNHSAHYHQNYMPELAFFYNTFRGAVLPQRWKRSRLGHARVTGELWGWGGVQGPEATPICQLVQQAPGGNNLQVTRVRYAGQGILFYVKLYLDFCETWMIILCIILAFMFCCKSMIVWIRILFIYFLILYLYWEDTI